MKIGVFGTGMVGSTIAAKLIQLNHDVKMGSRTLDNAKALEWTKANGAKASHGTFSDAAAFGEILFNCTHGMNSIDALKLAGEKNIDEKILIDVSNPLDFSKGMPPSLSVCNTDSLGEQIQRTFPNVKVVKALNTVNCKIMVDPSLIHGEHDIFIAGNDKTAKEKASQILKEWFGWRNVTDLGDITGARAMEMLLPMWVRLMGVFNTANFNYKVVR